jgi:hypothetical protein
VDIGLRMHDRRDAVERIHFEAGHGRILLALV